MTTTGDELLVLDGPSAQARLAPSPMPHGWGDVPCAVAVTVRVPDLDRVRHILLRNNVLHVRMYQCVRVPPSRAGNVVLEFVA